jgi:BASS family bile acid:Na+ symporter
MPMPRLAELIPRLFAVWTLAGAAWAWFVPEHFTWFVDPDRSLFGLTLVNLGLGLIMFGMGVTLSPSDFAEVARQPRRTLIGLLAQFAVMPALGYLAARIFRLEPGLAAGLILVACCPGGTASNVVTYLARGNVALSVVMTLMSTLAAVALTPLLAGWLAGTYVAVDRWNLVGNLLAVVLFPVMAGMACHRFLPRFTDRLSPWAPVLSVVLIVLIVGGILGASKETIRDHFGKLAGAVVFLHAGGFWLGQIIATLLGWNRKDRRTLGIEVGMQNSGLGSALAKTPRFQDAFLDPAQAALAPVPGALSALCHCLIGSLLAAWWRRHDEDEAP